LDTALRERHGTVLHRKQIHHVEPAAPSTEEPTGGTEGDVGPDGAGAEPKAAEAEGDGTEEPKESISGAVVTDKIPPDVVSDPSTDPVDEGGEA